MRKREFYTNDVERRYSAMLACELDSSLLDLLCEDGFLRPSELPEEDSPKKQLALIRRAIRRGFLMENRDADASADMLVVKNLDSLRIWMDLVDEDVHLRAPPRCT